MIVNGREFNFGRCVRIDLYKGKDLFYRIEHKPEIDPNYYIAMDLEVTDMPSARAADKPGFQAKVTIYNPSKDLLTAVASGATWIRDFVSPETEQVIAGTVKTISAAAKTNGLKQYYASRLKAQIYAGYVGVSGEPNYTRIIGGYVNGSSFSHKNTDDVLTLGIYDIDMTEISPVTVEPEVEKEAKSTKTSVWGWIKKQFVDKNKNKFADTWHNTLAKYIEKYETDFIDDEDSYNYRIVYAKSLNAWKKGKSAIDTNGNKSIFDEALKAKLTKQKMPNGGVNADNLAGMLNGLCAVAETRVNWYRDVEDVSMNTYVIYPVGRGKVIVPGRSADIQIWNYQNLLETPSIDGAGKMTIKMLFNPQCVCGKNIALMLEKDLGQTDVTRNIASFESSIVKGGGMIGSMSSTGNDAAIANNQITGNTNVQSQRKGTDAEKKMGYLFNSGFPIIRVTHTLSTYGPNWTTTVQTTPIATSGLKIEG